MDVMCDAQINPNDHTVVYIDIDLPDFGWCRRCNEEVILYEIENVKSSIMEKYDNYIREYGKTPDFAECLVVFNDKQNGCTHKCICLSGDIGPKESDKEIFLSVDGVESLMILAGASGTFTVVDVIEFFNE